MFESMNRYYAPQAMDNNCLTCDAGKTAASEGATRCDACAAGFYASNKVCFTNIFLAIDLESWKADTCLSYFFLFIC